MRRDRQTERERERGGGGAGSGGGGGGAMMISCRSCARGISSAPPGNMGNIFGCLSCASDPNTSEQKHHQLRLWVKNIIIYENKRLIQRFKKKG